MRWLRRLAGFALALTLAFGVGIGFLGWRLAHGPLELKWLVDRLQTAANADGGPTRLTIGSAALEWGGFTSGVGEPIVIGVRDVAVVDATGKVLLGVPRGEVTLSFSEMLLGHLRPNAVELDNPKVSVVLSRSGAMALDIGSLSEVADAAIPGGPAPPKPQPARPLAPAFLSDLHHVIVRDAAAEIDDRALGVHWSASHLDVDVSRHGQGAIGGRARVDIALGAVHVALKAEARVERNGVGSDVTFDVSPFVPSQLAAESEALAPLAAIDAPVSTTVRTKVSSEFEVHNVDATINVAAGAVRVAATPVEIGAATLAVTADRQAVQSATLKVEFPHPGAPPTRLSGRANGRRSGHGFEAVVVVDLDALPVARLPAVWPEGVGGPGSRPWLVQNLTAGTLRNGHAEVSLTVPEDFSDAAVTSATGTLDGDDVTVHWLRPIPPIEHVAGKLSIVDPDTLDIAAQSGRQSGTALTLKGSRVRISGLAGHRQVADIAVQIGGPIADALAALHQPRLHLFDRHPLDLHDPSGQVTGKIGVKLPLEDKLQMDDIAIQAQGTMTDAHLSAIVAGHALDHGMLDFDARNDGGQINGRAELAGIPAQLGVELDFRLGPPDQALQKVTVSGAADSVQIAAAGLRVGDFLTGKVGVQASLIERRDGRADFVVHGEFKDAGIAVAPLGWRKAPGSAAAGQISGRMLHDRITGIDQISLDGEALRLRGSVDFADGKPREITVSDLVIGQTSGRGQIRFAKDASSAEPLAVTVSGPVIDLSQRFATHSKAAAKSSDDATSKSAWTIDARFDKALVGNGRTFEAIDMHAEATDGIAQKLRLSARTGPNGRLTAAITPGAGERRLNVDAADAGALLAGLDVVKTMEGGRLTLSGRYDDTAPDRPLNGTAEIVDFRIRKAPGLGKLLQAATLYGLVDALSGPGLNFTRLEAPFRYTSDVLELNDARAFSASLGLTGKGRIDMARDAIDMQGTVVPAYMLNSALGGIPVIGKLFSAEKGGGLLAMSFTLRGPLADPTVSVNPLSALTPGALRQLFH